MSIAQSALSYVVAAVVFLGLDAIWLGTMTSRIYRPGIGHLMADKPVFGAAAAFYLIYVAGIVFFAVLPALQSRRPLTALALGALLGLLCYATYDLTNQATLKGWPWHVTALDLLWGAFVTGMAALAACWATLAFQARG